MKIWEAIQQLLKIKQFCTIAEIARIVEKKQAYVLREITKNLHLLRIDKKHGRIIGFVDTANPQYAAAYEAGLCYKLGQENYNTENVIYVVGTQFDHIREDYWCGGMGDSYKINIIKDNPENLKVIRDAGVVYIKEIRIRGIDDLWTVPPPA
jgi:hypothetical protein